MTLSITILKLLKKLYWNGRTVNKYTSNITLKTIFGIWDEDTVMKIKVISFTNEYMNL